MKNKFDTFKNYFYLIIDKIYNFKYIEFFKDLALFTKEVLMLLQYIIFAPILYLFNITLGRIIEELAMFLERVKIEIKENEKLRNKLELTTKKIFAWFAYIFTGNAFTAYISVLLILGLIFGWQIYVSIASDTQLLLCIIYKYQPFNIFDYFKVITFWIFFFFTGISTVMGLKLDIRLIAFNFSLFFFILIIILVANYGVSSTFVISLTSIECTGTMLKAVPNKWSIFFFGYDGLSLSFLLLTTFIFPIVILTAWDRIVIRPTFFYFNIIFLELLIIGAFLALDLFLFFIFFEFIFVPMALIVFIWGGRQRKIKASSYLLMYAVFSSIFFLIGILYVQSIFKSTNLFYIMGNLGEMTVKDARALWVLFFIPFAVKVPMFPFHIWLPEAHVEAPTAGSIILASVLLKLGGYGIIRFLFTIFRDASMFFSPFVCLLALLSMVYASLIAFRQTDFKKVIAYSSIIHMNLSVLGLFTFDINAVYGAIMLMLGHGIVSGALFFLVGVLYDRHHTRTILYYGGLAQVMPLFTGFFFFFIIANFGFPCSLSFIGEFIIFIGLYDKLGIIICLIVGFCSLLGTYLNIQLFTSLCYGTSNSKWGSVYQDLTEKELLILLILTLAGVMTFIFHAPLSSLLSHSNTIYVHLFI